MRSPHEGGGAHNMGRGTAWRRRRQWARHRVASPRLPEPSGAPQCMGSRNEVGGAHPALRRQCPYGVAVRQIPWLAEPVWSPQPMGSPHEVRALHCVGRRIAWGRGTHGAVKGHEVGRPMKPPDHMRSPTRLGSAHPPYGVVEVHGVDGMITSAQPVGSPEHIVDGSTELTQGPNEARLPTQVERHLSTQKQHLQRHTQTRT